MGGRRGGGGGAAQAAAIQAERERERVAEEREAREVEQVRREQAATQAAAQRAARQSAARERALGRAQQLVTNRGEAWNDNWANTFNSRLADQDAMMLPDTEDFGSYYGDNFLNSVINEVRDTRRRELDRQLDARYGNGFVERTFDYTMDDAIRDAVLNAQRAEAAATAERARNRGQLNEAGYLAAIERINQLATAGRSQADALTNAVIDRYRGGLNDVIGQGRSRVASYDLGRAISLDDIFSSVDSAVERKRANLEGDVTNALAGQSFFDVGDYITMGGQAQGAANPTPAFLDAQAERQRIRQVRRGVGGQGVF
jgi:hypothetical protein